MQDICGHADETQNGLRSQLTTLRQLLTPQAGDVDIPLTFKELSWNKTSLK